MLKLKLRNFRTILGSILSRRYTHGKDLVRDLKKFRTVGKFTTSTVALLSLLLISSSAALADSRDAVNTCGATDVVAGEGADMPNGPGLQGFKVYTPRTPGGNFPNRCGNGVMTRAEHNEVKHRVPSWGDALQCINKALLNFDGELDKGNTNNYIYRFTGGSVVVVTGSAGSITAYPQAANEARKWRFCAGSS